MSLAGYQRLNYRTLVNSTFSKRQSLGADPLPSCRTLVNLDFSKRQSLGVGPQLSYRTLAGLISHFHLSWLVPLPKRLDRLDAQWCRLGPTSWQLTVPLLSVDLGAYLTLMRHTHGPTILHQRLVAVKRLRVGF